MQSDLFVSFPLATSRRLRIFVAALLSLVCATSSAQHPPWNQPVATSRTLHIGGAVLRVDFGAGSFDLPPEAILHWVEQAAQAVTTYYGHYPVARTRILILPVAGRSGVLQGTTWGDVDGFPALTRMRIGQHSTAADLAEDWTMTHELVHAALPTLPDDDHWLEEGLSTYVEPIARVQAAQLPAETIWSDMFRDMRKGLPAPSDAGLEQTHTWASTYWGGGLFCLLADIEIREKTANRKGLQDALRGVVAAGGSIDHEWPIERVLSAGDKATGTTVLKDLFARMGRQRGTVDLDVLWQRLGVSRKDGVLVFDDKAPLAAIRRSITLARK